MTSRDFSQEAHYLDSIQVVGLFGKIGVGAIEDVLGAPVPERAYHGLHYNDTRDSHQTYS